MTDERRGRPRKEYEDAALAALREKQREAMKRYYQEHKDEILQAKRKTKDKVKLAAEDVKAKRAEYHRKWLQEHPEKLQEYATRYAEKHKETAKEWAKQNREKTRQSSKEYRERQKEQVAKLRQELQQREEQERILREKALKADMLAQQVEMLMNKVALLA